MKKLFSCMAVLCLLFNTAPLNGQTDECVLVIQGARAKADEDFIRNSTDILVKGMGTFPGPPRITVIRPTGPTEKGSQLGANPTRSEQTYSDKAALLQQIRDALCKEECKNVVIALIGHGIGSTGLNTPPVDSLTGGMKIGNANTQDDVLWDHEIAALIDSCKKSVKLISSACYSESMVRGIRHHVKNKGLIGVGIASSPWDSLSYASGSTPSKMYYDFIKAFLEDFYAIIGDPNAMAELAKRAEELKKENDKYNEEIKNKIKALAEAKKKCEEDVAKMAADSAACSQQLAEVKNKLMAATSAISLLNARKQLEMELDDLKEQKKAEKNAKKKKEIQDAIKQKEKELADNTTALKGLGIQLKGGTLEKKLEQIDAELAKQEANKAILENEKEALEKEWVKKRNALIDQRELCDSLMTASDLATIPDHTPLMEVVIHEAFKSARVKTGSSTPKEPIAPPTAGITMPDKPLSTLKVGDKFFRLYKVWDKAANKCVVVGYEISNEAAPINPIKSIECDTACNLAKFSYQDGDQVKVVEAKKDEMGKYKIKVDDTTVEDARFLHARHPVILPGQLLEDVYYAVGFGQITDVHISHSQVLSFQEADGGLDILFQRNGQFHQIRLEFLEHDEVQIHVDQALPYLRSQVRRYTLLTEDQQPFGEIGLIQNAGAFYGTLRLTSTHPPVALIGNISPDGTSFFITGLTSFGTLMITRDGNIPGDMVWILGTQQGVVLADDQNEPEIPVAQVFSNPDGRDFLTWVNSYDHLNESEQLAILGTRILKMYQNGTMTEAIEVGPLINEFVDPEDLQPSLIGYVLVPVINNSSYDVVHPYPRPPEFGSPFFLAVEPEVSSFGHDANVGESREALDMEELQVFLQPNPFSFSTNLNVYVPQPYSLSIQIWTSNGLLARDITRESVVGWQQFILVGDELPHPGWYYYRIATPVEIHTGKLIYLGR